MRHLCNENHRKHKYYWYTNIKRYIFEIARHPPQPDPQEESHVEKKEEKKKYSKRVQSARSKQRRRSDIESVVEIILPSMGRSIDIEYTLPST